MRPPQCYVCLRTWSDFPDDDGDYFTLIYFGETPEEKMAPSRVLADLGRAGHPNNAVWFCRDHVTVARRHENRHRDEGLSAIKAHFEAAG